MGNKSPVNPQVVGKQGKRGTKRKWEKNIKQTERW